MRTRGSVVVITGASDGVGRATALRLAQDGAAVVLAARRSEALEEVATECRRRGGRALAVPTDVAREQAVAALANRAVAEFGRIDAWINNAAVGIAAPFAATPLTDIRRVVDVDVMGVVHGMQEALTQMRRQGAGVVVNVSSVLGEIPAPYAGPYSMSKAAIRALAVSVREELRLDGAKGIHVCTVLPPSIDTPFFGHVANYTGRAARPIPPTYPPEQVAEAIRSVLRRPRREVVIGCVGRTLVLKHRLFPAVVEHVMGSYAGRTYLSRRRVDPTTGNLYGDDGTPPAVTGGHHGRRKTAVRKFGVFVAAGAAVAAVAGRR
ncbi:SDR family oxidoreductase [Georgenia deserti]|uniref:SDR family oxidoreductase n=1 Tax=Georgenia deserti TaxID=2093781 RepID=A0ABW4L5A0_9MICO